MYAFWLGSFEYTAPMSILCGTFLIMSAHTPFHQHRAFA
jgi:hypothetical protein